MVYWRNTNLAYEIHAINSFTTVKVQLVGLQISLQTDEARVSLYVTYTINRFLNIILISIRE